jgi:hypothetical protein
MEVSESSTAFGCSVELPALDESAALYVCCAYAEPNAPIIAAAVRLTASFPYFMHVSFHK